MTGACAETGCPHAATHVPQVFVPARGWPPEERHAISMILAVPMCRRHCEAFEPAQILDVSNAKGATLRDSLIPILAKARPGSVEPDCDRAWATPLRMNSGTYRDYLKAMGKPHG